MTVKRMDHVGIVVSDLAAARRFFGELGLVEEGGGRVGGDLVARIIGVPDPRSELVMLATPDGVRRIELVAFESPDPVPGASDAPAHAIGLRHLCFEVDDVADTVRRLEACGGELVGEIVNYENVYRLCYLRGPDGLIVELAEPVR